MRSRCATAPRSYRRYRAASRTTGGCTPTDRAHRKSGTPREVPDRVAVHLPPGVSIPWRRALAAARPAQPPTTQSRAVEKTGPVHNERETRVSSTRLWFNRGSKGERQKLSTSRYAVRAALPGPRVTRRAHFTFHIVPDPDPVTVVGNALGRAFKRAA